MVDFQNNSIFKNTYFEKLTYPARCNELSPETCRLLGVGVLDVEVPVASDISLFSSSKTSISDFSILFLFSAMVTFILGIECSSKLILCVYLVSVKFELNVVESY